MAVAQCGSREFKKPEPFETNDGWQLNDVHINCDTVIKGELESNPISSVY